MSKAKISVIVPVYNVEKYLSKCLDSILAQDYDNYEIIVVDDGSLDNCPAICDEYAKKEPDRIRVIHQENKGLGGARNTGIEVANGEYIAFMDSDDTIAPNMLSALMTEIVNCEADMAVCSFANVSPNGQIGNVFGTYGMQLHLRMTANEHRELFSVTPSACNKLFKITLFTETGIRFPSKVWYEDLRTIYKIFALSKGIVFTDKPLYFYLLRDGSIMRNTNLARNSEIMDAMDDLLEFYQSSNLFDKYKSELEFLTVQHVFWEATVRILQATGKHELLSQFRNYTFSKFPNALKNKQFKKFVSEEGIKGKVVMFCLRFKLYRILHLILKLRHSLTR